MLNYDSDELLLVAEKFKKYYNWHAKTDYSDSTYGELKGKFLKDNQYIKELCSRLPPEFIRSDSAQFMLFQPNHFFIPHKDINIVRENGKMRPTTNKDPFEGEVRQATVIFPLTPAKPAPVQWYDNGWLPGKGWKNKEQTQLLYTHHYRCPTIINVRKDYHSVKNSFETRINFQISLFASFEEILEYHKKGILVR